MDFYLYDKTKKINETYIVDDLYQNLKNCANKNIVITNHFSPVNKIIYI